MHELKDGWKLVEEVPLGNDVKLLFYRTPEGEVDFTFVSREQSTFTLSGGNVPNLIRFLATDMLNLLAKLNRIEHLLDTVEYTPSVPIAKWYACRGKIIKALRANGLEEVQVEDIEIDGKQERRYVLFSKEIEVGFPEEWEGY